MPSRKPLIIPPSESAQIEPPARNTEAAFRSIHFQGKQSGFKTPDFERRMMADAEQQALNWLNKHPEIKLLTITSAMGSMSAIVTIWYKQS